MKPELVSESNLFKRLHFDASQLLFAAALVVLLFQFGLALIEYTRHAQAALNFPYPLDYSEGPVLNQVMRLTQGDSIYRADLSTAPYTITTNPPLFQLIQAPLAHFFGAAFWYGRAVSILSILVAGVLLALIVQTITDDWFAAVISGLLLMAFPHILQDSAFDRADSVALALSLAGLFAVVRWPNARKGWLLAGALFAAAVYTKFSYGFAAPLTALIWLWQGKHRQQMLRLAGLFAGICLGLFLLLSLLTNGGFYLNTVPILLNRISAENFMANAIDLLFHAPYLVLGSALFIFLERLGDHTRSWSLVTPYLLLTVFAILIETKAGSTIADVYQPVAGLCLVVGAIIAWPSKEYRVKAGLCLVLAIQVSSLVNISQAEYVPFVMNKVNDTREISKLADRVQHTSGLMLADEYMGLLPLSGRPVYFQPLEFWGLNQAKLWDDKTLIATIQRHEFALVILYEPFHGEPTIVTRWSPPVRNAIWDNYRQDGHLGDAWIYVPKQ